MPPHRSAPSFRLDGRTALVTGASAGIGRAAAAALAEQGAAVTLVARTAAKLETAVTEIRQGGGNAAAMPLDVTDTDAVAAALVATGPFDILVNSAGINRPRPFTEVTTDDFDAILGLNLRALFFISQSVVKGLMAAGRPGSIIHISSHMGHVGGRLRTAYCASKHAVEGLAKAMAADLAPAGIRVNTICPTFIETELTRSSFADPAMRAEIVSKIPLGRVGTVEDVTGAVVYLASDASALVTGTSIVVDGGWTAI